jgi:hypothetical protein
MLLQLVFSFHPVCVCCSLHCVLCRLQQGFPRSYFPTSPVLESSFVLGSAQCRLLHCTSAAVIQTVNALFACVNARASSSRMCLCSYCTSSVVRA